MCIYVYISHVDFRSCCNGFLYNSSPGFVPVTIRPPQSNNLPACLPTIKLTLEISNVLGVLTTHNIARILKSKVYGFTYLRRCSSLWSTYTTDVTYLPPFFLLS